MFHHAIRAAALALALSALAGCQRSSAPTPEQAALKELQDYEPKVILDEQGNVVRLNFEGKHFDDAAMETIPQFKKLKELSLAHSSITDAGLAKVREIKRLEQIGLVDSRVTDRGLATLHKVPSLRQIWLRSGNERITPAGVEALKKALPGLVVHDLGVKAAPPPKKG